MREFSFVMFMVFQGDSVLVEVLENYVFTLMALK